ncbi:MAG: MotA/TolQ/ExbB proton channel family protein [Mariniblastus sp.]|nr:MotA/TolQ/ExbB proton channel family protein [Mariniblastus sp.]
MSQQRRINWTRALPALVIPICLGLSLYLGISFLIEQDLIEHPTLRRYLAGHPISKITLALFCIGFASLVMIADNLGQQFRAFNRVHLSPDLPDRGARGSGQRRPLDRETDSTAERAARSLGRLHQYPNRIHGHYLWQRLEKGLQFIQRNESTQGVEDELKYHADLDIERQQQRYSLVRILVWAIPMLGFLGTVLGISQALGGIQVGPENDFQQMMSGLRSSLYVAFDTTALALTLSIVLMFIQFLVDRFEVQLLSMVDQKVVQEMAGHFEKEPATDAGTVAMERMGKVVMASSYQLVQRQAELWKATIQDAEAAWKTTVSDSNEAVTASLKESFSQVVDQLQVAIGKNIVNADECMSKRWEQWQVMLSDNARAVAGQQAEMVRQSESLSQLIEQIRDIQSKQGDENQKTGFVVDENRLNDTLQTLCSAISDMKPVVKTTDDDVPAPRRGELPVYQASAAIPSGWQSSARPISVDTFVSNNKTA